MAIAPFAFASSKPIIEVWVSCASAIQVLISVSIACNSSGFSARGQLKSKRKLSKPTSDPA